MQEAEECTDWSGHLYTANNRAKLQRGEETEGRVAAEDGGGGGEAHQRWLRQHFTIYMPRRNKLTSKVPGHRASKRGKGRGGGGVVDGEGVWGSMVAKRACGSIPGAPPKRGRGGRDKVKGS